MSFYYLYSLIGTKLMKYLCKILFVLIVNYFSSILWCEHNMVFAHPFRMCKTIRFVRHEITSSCNIGLDTFIICRGDLYRITYCLHPRSRWIFALAIPFFGTRKTPWSTHTKVHNKKDHPDIFLRMTSCFILFITSNLTSNLTSN